MADNVERWIKKGSELLAEIKDYKNPNAVCLWRLGQCGFVIKYNDITILIDPMLNDLIEDGKSRRLYDSPFSGSDAAEALDINYVICTHGHADHLAKETILGIMSAKKDTTFIVPTGCKAIMSELLVNNGVDNKVIYMSDLYMCDLSHNISIKAFSAAHPEHYLDEDDDRMALCYEIKLGNKVIMHLGDTYLTERLFSQFSSAERIDLLLPPINGDDLFRQMRNCIGNMEAEEAAKLAVRLDVKYAIPTHYDMVVDNTVNPYRFIEELKVLGAGEKGKLLALGEGIEI